MASKRDKLLKYMRLYGGTYGHLYWTPERVQELRRICNEYGLECIHNQPINTLSNAIYEYFKESYNDALYDATNGYCKPLICPCVDDILDMCEQDTVFNRITDEFIHEIESTFDFDEEMRVSQEVLYRSVFGSQGNT